LDRDLNLRIELTFLSQLFHLYDPQLLRLRYTIFQMVADIDVRCPLQPIYVSGLESFV
jgi:hypothetical protein